MAKIRYSVFEFETALTTAQKRVNIYYRLNIY